MRQASNCFSYKLDSSPLSFTFSDSRLTTKVLHIIVQVQVDWNKHDIYGHGPSHTYNSGQKSEATCKWRECVFLSVASNNFFFKLMRVNSFTLWMTVSVEASFLVWSHSTMASYYPPRTESDWVQTLLLIVEHHFFFSPLFTDYWPYYGLWGGGGGCSL